jgi:hypothetical protein
VECLGQKRRQNFPKRDKNITKSHFAKKSDLSSNRLFAMLAHTHIEGVCGGKLIFSKKATKIDKIFTLDLTVPTY